MTDLLDIILDDVGRRSGQLARTTDKDSVATSDDDKPILSTFYDDGLLALLILSGVIQSTSDYLDPESAPNPMLLPRELWTALTYYILKEWFKTIGEIELFQLYDMEYEKESTRRRFSPGTISTATRTYRGI